MANVPASYGAAPDAERETVCKLENDRVGVDKTSKAKHDDPLIASLHGRGSRAASLPRSHKPRTPAPFLLNLLVLVFSLAFAVARKIGRLGT